MENIGKYKILGTLGRGSMGIVYKGQDPEIGRLVAIKTLRKVTFDAFDKPEEALERFKIEAKSAGNLRHPNIITVFDVNVEGETPYIVMDYVEGVSLDQVLKEEGKLGIDRTIQYLEQLASAIDLAHSKNIIHRDIKPSNLIIDNEDNIYILDFGIAKINETLSKKSNMVQEEPIMGTPGYMSPEQILNDKLDYKTDIFSLAVVGFECFTGERPFIGDNFNELISNILNSPPKSLTELAPELPLALEAEFEKALSKDQKGRHESAMAMVKAFKRALGIGQGLAPAVSSSQVMPKNTAYTSSSWRESSHKASNAKTSISAWQDLSYSKSKAGTLFSAPRTSTKVHPGSLFERDVLAKDESVGGGGDSFFSFKRYFILLVAGLAIIAGVFQVWRVNTAENSHIDDSGIIITDSVDIEDDYKELFQVPNVQVPDNVPVSSLSDNQLVSLISQSNQDPQRIKSAIVEAINRKPFYLTEALIKALDHDSYLVRIAALKALGELRDKRAVPMILNKLDDYDDLVRAWAAKALADIGSKKSIGYLMVKYKQENTPQVKKAIKMAIEKINGYPLNE